MDAVTEGVADTDGVALAVSVVEGVLEGVGPKMVAGATPEEAKAAAVEPSGAASRKSKEPKAGPL